jgi:hypothetical protein
MWNTFPNGLGDRINNGRGKGEIQLQIAQWNTIAPAGVHYTTDDDGFGSIRD